MQGTTTTAMSVIGRFATARLIPVLALMAATAGPAAAAYLNTTAGGQ